ncbi:MAG: hypothetical protein IJ814_08045 [Paludibacteraceae bacterium]|nr:hypothetical protein [Paludibacteraceae bacterium]
MSAREMTLHEARMGLLRVVGQMKSVEQIQELRQIVSNYYAQKVTAEMDRLWENGEWSAEKNEAILNTHLRTPYRYSEQ